MNNVLKKIAAYPLAETAKREEVIFGIGNWGLTAGDILDVRELLASRAEPSVAADERALLRAIGDAFNPESSHPITENQAQARAVGAARAALARAPLPGQGDEPAAWMVGRQLFISRDAIPFNLLPPLAHPVPLYLAAPAQAGDALPDCGHGHVHKRADGVKARCGGPGLCKLCARDLAAMSASQDQREAK